MPPDKDDQLSIFQSRTEGRAFEALVQSPWVITPAYLHRMAEIAAKVEHKVSEGELEAVLTRRAERLDRAERASVREGVAIVPVVGPIFRRANLFTEISGGTSTEMLAADFGRALEDEAVRAIVLSIDSPGGQVNGIAEFAEHIFRARETKPVIAHVGDLGLSGGYWIAAAADRVIASPTAELGSIGVVATVFRDESEDVIRIISSQSPRKRMDPGTEEGRAALQALVDDIAAVFIDAVARNRGVDRDTVIERFGRGGAMVGQRAVEAGLADELATLEDAVAMAADEGNQQQETFLMSKETVKTEPKVESYTAEQITSAFIREHFPKVAEALVDVGRAEVRGEIDTAKAEATTAERARIKGVLDQGAGLTGHEALVEKLAFEEPATPEQAAVQILAAEREQGAQVLARRKGASPDPLPGIATPTGDQGAIDPGDTSDEGLKRQWDQSAKLKEEFMDFEAFAAYMRAEKAGQVKRLSNVA